MSRSNLNFISLKGFNKKSLAIEKFDAYALIHLTQKTQLEKFEDKNAMVLKHGPSLSLAHNTPVNWTINVSLG